MRSNRILNGTQQVIRHDLPNQLVALQGLLHLLDADETDRLSGAGREYVRRLQNAAKRAGDLVRFLKQTDELRAQEPRLVKLSLAALGRDLEGELRRLHPEEKLACEWNWREPTVVADARTFVKALAQVIAELTIEKGAAYGIRAASARHAHGTMLTFELGMSLSAARHWSQHALDQSLEIALGRERLAQSKCVLEIAPAARERIAFRIVATDP